MKPRVALFFLCALLTAAVGPARAQDTYPSRPVRIMVPFPPTSPIDVIARLVASKLTDRWGKPVVIDNKPGATGSLGADMVAKALPDGYTLLFTADFSLTMYAAIAKQLPYNPVTDFKPVATIARTQNGLFINPGIGVSTVEELIAVAKQRPGKLVFSTAGVASPSHFAAEQFKAAAGVDMLHVPYKGGPPAMTAVVTGEASMSFGPIPQAIAYVRAGKLKALAVTGTATSPLLPGVKPLIEQGFPGLVMRPWFPVLAPARTPDSVTDIVRETIRKVMDDPELRARLEFMGIEPVWEGPEEVKRAIEADIKRWKEVAQRAGMERQ